MMDLLAAKELVEQGLIILRWVPTQHQYADHLTKSMVCELLKKHLKTGRICLIQTGADREHEEHKAALCRGQRVRRKARMRELEGVCRLEARCEIYLQVLADGNAALVATLPFWDVMHIALLPPALSKATTQVLEEMRS